MRLKNFILSQIIVALLCAALLPPEAVAQGGLFDINEPKTQFLPIGKIVDETFTVLAPKEPVITATATNTGLFASGSITVTSMGLSSPGVFEYRIQATPSTWTGSTTSRLSYITLRAEMPEMPEAGIREVRFAVKAGDQGKMPAGQTIKFGDLGDPDFKLKDRFSSSYNMTGPNPVFADIDNDGFLECVTAVQAPGHNSWGRPNSSSQTGRIRVLEYKDGDKKEFKASFDGKDIGLELPRMSSNQYYLLRPTFGDVDNDGDLDCMIGFNRASPSSDRGGFFYFENKLIDKNGGGTLYFQRKGNPVFNLPSRYPTDLKSSSSTNGLSRSDWNMFSPSLVDLNYDGKLDLFFSSGKGTFHYYLNEATGADDLPKFRTRNDGATGKARYAAGAFGLPFNYSGSKGQMRYDVTSVFVDYDGDGDEDVLFGDYDNSIGYFENIAGKGNLPKFASGVKTLWSKYGNSKVAEYQTVTIADVDGDGKVELYTGRRKSSSGSGLGPGLFSAKQEFSADFGAQRKDVCMTKNNTESADLPEFNFTIINPDASKYKLSNPTWHVSDSRYLESVEIKTNGVSGKKHKFKVVARQKRNLQVRNMGPGSGSVLITVSVELVSKSGSGNVILNAERLKTNYEYFIEDCEEPANGSVEGLVFDDRNYEGGPGSDFDGGVGDKRVHNATVEIYRATSDTDGIFLKSVKTGADGKYRFEELAQGDYFVRVVSGTVKADRGDGTEMAVQTFRTDPSSTEPFVTDEIGGPESNKGFIDGLVNVGEVTLETLRNSVYNTQSVSKVEIGDEGSGNNSQIEDVDFGYSFYAVTNTNSTGQGSLAQAIHNANVIDDDAINSVTEHIRFAIPGSGNAEGHHEIMVPISGFEDIVTEMIIDGSMKRVGDVVAPEATPRKNGQHDLRIALNASNLDASKTAVFNVKSSREEVGRNHSIIQGFMVYGANKSGQAVVELSANGTTVRSNYLGFTTEHRLIPGPESFYSLPVDVDSQKNNEGIRIVASAFGGDDNVIGGKPAGVGDTTFLDQTYANYISNNVRYGLRFVSDGAEIPERNFVASNVFGLGPDFPNVDVSPTRESWESGTFNVLGNWADGAGAEGETSILLLGKENTLWGNLIREAQTGGIYVKNYPKSIASGGLIYGNVIRGCSGNAIQLERGLSEYVVGGLGRYDANFMTENVKGVVIGKDKDLVPLMPGESFAENIPVMRNYSYLNSSKMAIDLGDDLITRNDDKDEDIGPNTKLNYIEFMDPDPGTDFFPAKMSGDGKSIELGFRFNGEEGHYALFCYTDNIREGEDFRDYEPGQGRHFFGVVTFKHEHPTGGGTTISEQTGITLYRAGDATSVGLDDIPTDLGSTPPGEKSQGFLIVNVVRLEGPVWATTTDDEFKGLNADNLKTKMNISDWDDAFDDSSEFTLTPIEVKQLPDFWIEAKPVFGPDGKIECQENAAGQKVIKLPYDYGNIGLTDFELPLFVQASWFDPVTRETELIEKISLPDGLKALPDPLKGEFTIPVPCGLGKKTILLYIERFPPEIDKNNNYSFLRNVEIACGFDLDFQIQSFGPFCEGSNPTLKIEGAQDGVTYQAFTSRGNTLIGEFVGADAEWAPGPSNPDLNFSLAGDYPIKLKAIRAGCDEVVQDVTIRVTKEPGVAFKNLGWGGMYHMCEGAENSEMFFDSDPGVSYDLKLLGSGGKEYDVYSLPADKSTGVEETIVIEEEFLLNNDDGALKTGSFWAFKFRMYASVPGGCPSISEVDLRYYVGTVKEGLEIDGLGPVCDGGEITLTVKDVKPFRNTIYYIRKNSTPVGVVSEERNAGEAVGRELPLTVKTRYNEGGTEYSIPVGTNPMSLRATYYPFSSKILTCDVNITDFDLEVISEPRDVTAKAKSVCPDNPVTVEITNPEDKVKYHLYSLNGAGELGALLADFADASDEVELTVDQVKSLLSPNVTGSVRIGVGAKKGTCDIKKVGEVDITWAAKDFNTGLTVEGSQICEGETSATVRITNPEAGNSYWVDGYPGEAKVGQADGSALEFTVTVPGTVGIHSFNFFVGATDGESGSCSDILDNIAKVKVLAKPLAKGIELAETVCGNENVRIKVKDRESFVVYEAYQNGTILPAATSEESGDLFLTIQQTALDFTSGNPVLEVRARRNDLTSCSVSLGNITVERKAFPLAPELAPVMACGGKEVIFRLSRLLGDATYEVFYKNEGASSGSPLEIFIPSPAELGDGRLLYVEARNVTSQKLTIYGTVDNGSCKTDFEFVINITDTPNTALAVEGSTMDCATRIAKVTVKNAEEDEYWLQDGSDEMTLISKELNGTDYVMTFEVPASVPAGTKQYTVWTGTKGHCPYELTNKATITVLDVYTPSDLTTIEICEGEDVSFEIPRPGAGWVLTLSTDTYAYDEEIVTEVSSAKWKVTYKNVSRTGTSNTGIGIELNHSNYCQVSQIQPLTVRETPDDPTFFIKDPTCLSAEGVIKVEDPQDNILYNLRHVDGTTESVDLFPDREGAPVIFTVNGLYTSKPENKFVVTAHNKFRESCAISPLVTLKVTDVPKLDLTVPEVTLCEGGTLKLKIEGAEDQKRYSLLRADDSELASARAEGTTVTILANLPADTYPVGVYEFSVGVGSTSCDDKLDNKAKVTVVETPDVPAPVYEKMVCGNVDAQIRIPGGAKLTLVYEAVDDTGNKANGSVDGDDYVFTVPASYFAERVYSEKFKFTISGKSTASGDCDSDVKHTVNFLRLTPVVDAISDFEACLGEPVALNLKETKASDTYEVWQTTPDLPASLDKKPGGGDISLNLKNHTPATRSFRLSETVNRLPGESCTFDQNFTVKAVELPDTKLSPTVPAICEESSAVITVPGTENGFQYEIRTADNTTVLASWADGSGELSFTVGWDKIEPRWSKVDGDKVSLKLFVRVEDSCEKELSDPFDLVILSKPTAPAPVTDELCADDNKVVTVASPATGIYKLFKPDRSQVYSETLTPGQITVPGSDLEYGENDLDLEVYRKDLVTCKITLPAHVKVTKLEKPSDVDVVAKACMEEPGIVTITDGDSKFRYSLEGGNLTAPDTKLNFVSDFDNPSLLKTTIPAKYIASGDLDADGNLTYELYGERADGKGCRILLKTVVVSPVDNPGLNITVNNPTVCANEEINLQLGGENLTEDADYWIEISAGLEDDTQRVFADKVTKIITLNQGELNLSAGATYNFPIKVGAGDETTEICGEDTDAVATITIQKELPVKNVTIDPAVCEGGVFWVRVPDPETGKYTYELSVTDGADNKQIISDWKTSSDGSLYKELPSNLAGKTNFVTLVMTDKVTGCERVLLDRKTVEKKALPDEPQIDVFKPCEGQEATLIVKDAIKDFNYVLYAKNLVSNKLNVAAVDEGKGTVALEIKVDQKFLEGEYVVDGKVEFILEVQDFVTKCTNSVKIPVTFDKEPGAVLAPPPAEICEGEGLTLTIRNTKKGYYYQIFEDDRRIGLVKEGNGGDLLYDIETSDLPVGDHTFMLRAQGGSCDLKSESTFDVTVLATPQEDDLRNLEIITDDGYCQGGGDFRITLRNPRSGVVYSVKDANGKVTNGTLNAEGRVEFVLGADLPQVGSNSYDLIVRWKNGLGCEKTFEDAIGLNAYGKPVAVIMEDQTICEGSEATVSFTSEVPVRYWLVKKGGLITAEEAWVESIDEDSELKVSPTVTTQYDLYARYKRGTCDGIIVGSVTVNVIDQPDDMVRASIESSCFGQTTSSVIIEDPQPGIKYQVFRKSSNASVSDIGVSSAGESLELPITEAFEPGVYDLYVHATAGASCGRPLQVTLRYAVIGKPEMRTLDGPDGVCPGEDAVFNLTNPEAGITYTLEARGVSGKVYRSVPLGDILTFRIPNADLELGQTVELELYGANETAGCGKEKLDKVSLKAKELAPIKISAEEMCENFDGVILVIPTLTGHEYELTLPNGDVEKRSGKGDEIIFEIPASLATAGKVNLTLDAIDPSGNFCPNTQKFAVEVVAEPNRSLDVISDRLCEDGMAEITILKPEKNVNYHLVSLMDNQEVETINETSGDALILRFDTSDPDKFLPNEYDFVIKASVGKNCSYSFDEKIQLEILAKPFSDRTVVGVPDEVCEDNDAAIEIRASEADVLYTATAIAPDGTEKVVNTPVRGLGLDADPLQITVPASILVAPYTDIRVSAQRVMEEGGVWVPVDGCSSMIFDSQRILISELPDGEIETGIHAGCEGTVTYVDVTNPFGGVKYQVFSADGSTAVSTAVKAKDEEKIRLVILPMHISAMPRDFVVRGTASKLCGEATIETTVTIKSVAKPDLTYGVSGDVVCQGATEGTVTLSNSAADSQYRVIAEGVGIIKDWTTGLGGEMTLTVNPSALSSGEFAIKIEARRLDSEACEDVFINEGKLTVLAPVNKGLTLEVGKALCGDQPAELRISAPEEGVRYTVETNSGADTGVSGLGVAGEDLVLTIPSEWIDVPHSLFKVKAERPDGKGGFMCADYLNSSALVSKELDEEAPEFISFPANIYVEAQGASTTVTWDEPNATDNCALESVVGDRKSGSSFTIGKSEVTYVATDVSGNKTSQVLTVVVFNPGGMAGNPPTANPDFISLLPGESAVIRPMDNDIDPDGNLDLNSFRLKELAGHGEAKWNFHTKEFKYTAPADFVGQVSYTYEVYDTEGHKATTEIVIRVLEPGDVRIPRVFTPNGDGINDNFYIEGSEQYPNNRIKIYNRWGVKLFERGGYIDHWDGTASRGAVIGSGILPQGTYFFIFDKGDGSEPVRSNVFLKR
ncbi:hypothetical protein FUAX_25140 [Fulvitalea axinellae]|uniref:HYR domain-containing protein n=1 Tax=Fulvitalea axinellae TaxID=1182444 RepID=A0AAU9CSW8_9BACT|nr:hypothetical protein FUAX_25140 [Fulvitalea axinellae]